LRFFDIDIDIDIEKPLFRAIAQYPLLHQRKAALVFLDSRSSKATIFVSRSISQQMKPWPKPSIKRFGIVLAICWLLSPMGLAVLALVTTEELAVSSVLLTAGFVLPFVAATSYFAYRVLLTGAQGSKWSKTLLCLPPCAAVVCFLILNLVSYRVFLTAGEHDSPFDQIWYFWPQTSFGYPSSVIRVFDSPLPVEPYGARIVDLSSGLYNLWVLFGILFNILALEAILVALRKTGLSQRCESTKDGGER